jgi:hypothetical protein
MAIKRQIGLLFIMSIILLVSCGPRLIKDAYLANVVEQADADQVTLQMGPPDEVKKRSDGWEEWRYRDYQPTYPTKTPGLCSEYILRFDPNQVLRDWKRKDCGVKKDE